MSPRHLIVTAALATLAVAPTAEAKRAKTTVLKGTVVGAPYIASGKRTAIPVLISKQTARRARLKSPVGVLIVPRRRAVPTPDGKVSPSRLRIGDRWRGRARITNHARRAIYTRVSMKRAVVYKRSKTLSTAELEAMIKATRADLTRLTSFVNNLSAYTQRGFRDLDGRVSALRSDVDGLMRDVSALRAELAALKSRLDGVIASLEGISGQVTTELQPQVTQLLTTLESVTTLIGAVDCTTPGSLVERVCSLEVVGMPDGTALTGRVDQISSALTTMVNQLTNSTLAGDLPATLTTEVNTTLSSVYGLIGQVGGLLPQVSSLTDAQNSANTAITGLQTLVGGVNVTDLNSRLTTLLTSLGADTSTGAISGLTPAQLSAVQTQANMLQGILAGADSVLGNADDLNALIATANTNIAGLTSGQQLLTSKVNTICTDWRTALSGASAPVVDLVGLLIGTATLPTLPGCPTS